MLLPASGNLPCEWNKSWLNKRAAPFLATAVCGRIDFSSMCIVYIGAGVLIFPSLYILHCHPVRLCPASFWRAFALEPEAHLLASLGLAFARCQAITLNWSPAINPRDLFLCAILHCACQKGQGFVPLFMQYLEKLLVYVPCATSHMGAAACLVGLARSSAWDLVSPMVAFSDPLCSSDSLHQSLICVYKFLRVSQ